MSDYTDDVLDDSELADVSGGLYRSTLTHHCKVCGAGFASMSDLSAHDYREHYQPLSASVVPKA